MTQSDRQGRRIPSRTFRPGLEDGRLEDRVLLSSGKNPPALYHFLLTHPSARVAFNLEQPPFLQTDVPHFHHAFRKIKAVGVQIRRGGQAMEVTARDGSHYSLKLSYTSNTLATNIAEGQNGQLGVSTSQATLQQVSMQNVSYPQPIGTIRAYPMTGGRVGIIVDGTTNNVELTINPLGQPQKKGFSRSFAYGESGRVHILNIGQITVTSGQIGAILGFQTATLSGPLVATGTTPIDRIAFNALLPGSSITTGGDLNTLDVLNGIDLSGAGTGINIGRDLNLLNVGNNITLSNGATINVARNLGLVSQPPKGTGTGSNVLLLNFNTLQNTTVSGQTLPASVSTFIQGNVVINTGSEISIGGGINNGVYIEGTLTGYSRFFIFEGTPSQTNPPLASPPRPYTAPQFQVTVLGGISP